MRRSTRTATLLALAGAVSLPPALAAQPADPAHHFALRDSAEAAAYAEEHARAAEMYGRLVEAAPGDDALWVGLAYAEFGRGRLAEAAAAAERAIGLGFTFGRQGRFTLGWIHARLGDQDEALRWLRRALAEGYGDRPRFRTDTVFRSLRDDPAFRELAGIPPEGLTRDEGWRFDLRYFQEEVERMHAAPDRPGESPGFAAAVGLLHERIPSLTDEEVLIAFNRLAARLDDGHTAIHGVREDGPVDVDAGNIPLKFYEFADGVHVVDADSAHRGLVGARVERVGPLTPDSALAAFRGLRGGDNPMTIRWLGTQFYLRSLLHLRAIGAAEGDSAVFRLVVDGAPRTVTLRASDWSARRNLRPQTAADTARWLSRVDENYWMETVEPGLLYWQFNQVRDAEGGPDIDAFAGLLGDTLRASGTEHLVVDLRHNNGGNNTLVRPLVRTLVAWEQGDDDRTIWVLTGRNTFSAAQNFLNHVERWTDAAVVGEPSSSSPNFAGESTNLELPWSRVHGSLSNRYWQDSAPTDDRQWIYPDVPVALTAADYFAGRDPVLEAVRRIVRER